MEQFYYLIDDISGNIELIILIGGIITGTGFGIKWCIDSSNYFR